MCRYFRGFFKLRIFLKLANIFLRLRRYWWTFIRCTSTIPPLRPVAQWLLSCIGRPFLWLLLTAAVWIRLCWDCCCVCTRLRTPRPAFRSSRSSNRLRAGDWLEVYVRWRGRSRWCADAFLVSVFSAYHRPSPRRPHFFTFNGFLCRISNSIDWLPILWVHRVLVTISPFLWAVSTQIFVIRWGRGRNSSVISSHLVAENSVFETNSTVTGCGISRIYGE